jgi:hypothetical protein
MFDYHQKCYEAHERIAQRHREAQAERIIRRTRARRQRRRQVAAALARLTYAQPQLQA